MFLAILTYKLPFEEVQQHVQEHRNYLDLQYQAQKMIASGPMTDKTGGVLLFNVATRAEVDQIIANDPYHTRGAADYRVIEFSAVKSDARFRELFL